MSSTGKKCALRDLLEQHWSFIALVGCLVPVFRSYVLSTSMDLPCCNDFLAQMHWISSQSEAYYAWSKWSFGGIRFFYITSIVSLVDFVFKDPVSVTKSLVIGLILVCAASMYLFARTIFGSKEAALVSGLAYSLSPYFLQGMILRGHLDLMYGYALAPALLFILRGILTRGHRFSSTAAFSLLAVVAFLAYPSQMVYLGLLALVYVVYQMSCMSRESRSGSLVALAQTLLLASLISLGLLSFQLLPMIEGVTPTLLEGQVSFSPSQYKLWSIETIPAAIANPDAASWTYPVHLLGIAIILAIAITRTRYRRPTLFILVLYALGAILASAPRQSFADLYMAFGEQFPVPVVGLLVRGALHVATRWLLLSVFALSLLLGMVSEILKRHNRIQVKIAGHRTKRLVSTLPTFTIVLILLVGQFSILGSSLPLYTISDEYLDAYRIIKDDSTYFRVAPVPFNQQWMATPEGGQQQDLSRLILPFTGKPTLSPGWYGGQSDWIEYVDQLKLSDLGNRTSEILGLTGVKYVVIHEYPSSSGYEDQRYFRMQQGLVPVYSGDSINVYEDSFWVPPIYASTNVVLIVGGLESMQVLQALPKFALRDHVFLLAHTLDAASIWSLLTDGIVKEIVFANSEPTDIVLPLSNPSLVHVSPYANARSPSEGWVSYWGQSELGLSMTPWRGLPFLAPNPASTALDGSEVTLPMAVGEDGEYELWIRLACSDSEGFLDVSVDGVRVASVSANVPIQPPGLRWTRVALQSLSGGLHSVTLHHRTGPGQMFSDVDSVALVRASDRLLAMNRLKDLVQSQGIPVSFIFDFQRLLLFSSERANIRAANSYVVETPLGRQEIFGSPRGEMSFDLDFPLEFSLPADLSIFARGSGTMEFNLSDGARAFAVNSSGFAWLHGGTPLESSIISVSMGGQLEIARIVVSSGVCFNPARLNSSEVATQCPNLSRTSFERYSPESYLATIASNRTAVLVFSEAFHNLWTAKDESNSVTLHHIMANGEFNGFVVPEGSHELAISFPAHSYALAGATVSLALLLAVASILVVPRAHRALANRLRKLDPSTDHAHAFVRVRQTTVMVGSIVSWMTLLVTAVLVRRLGSRRA